MFIQRLVLHNWKNFKHADVRFKERGFIVGANASGKSNLLDALRFLRDIVRPDGGGLQYAVNQRGGISKIRCLAARQDSTVSLEVYLTERPQPSANDWRYQLTFKGGGGGFRPVVAMVVKEMVWQGQKQVLNRNVDILWGEGQNIDYELWQKTFLEQSYANQEFRQVSAILQSIQYLHLVPQLVREGDFYLSRKEDYYGRGLLDRMMQTNVSTREAHLKRINEVLRIAVPQLSELTFIRDDRGTPHLEARYKHWRPHPAKQQEAQFSDGTLRLIGLLWSLLDGTGPVLLEEPELYLHAAVVRQLPEFIARFQARRERKRQVILTTHSYDLLDTDTIAPEEVLVLEPTPEGTTVKQAQQIANVKAYLDAGFTMANSVLPQTAPPDINQLNLVNPD